MTRGVHATLISETAGATGPKQMVTLYCLGAHITLLRVSVRCHWQQARIRSSIRSVVAVLNPGPWQAAPDQLAVQDAQKPLPGEPGLHAPAGAAGPQTAGHLDPPWASQLSRHTPHACRSPSTCAMASPNRSPSHSLGGRGCAGWLQRLSPHLLEQAGHEQLVVWHAPSPAAQPGPVPPLAGPHPADGVPQAAPVRLAAPGLGSFCQHALLQRLQGRPKLAHARGSQRNARGSRCRCRCFPSELHPELRVGCIAEGTAHQSFAGGRAAVHASCQGALLWEEHATHRRPREEEELERGVAESIPEVLVAGQRLPGLHAAPGAGLPVCWPCPAPRNAVSTMRFWLDRAQLPCRSPHWSKFGMYPNCAAAHLAHRIPTPAEAACR